MSTTIKEKTFFCSKCNEIKQFGFIVYIKNEEIEKTSHYCGDCHEKMEEIE